MEIIIKQDALNLEIYKTMRKCVGWRDLSELQMEKGIKNCLTNFVAFCDGQPIGMGRVVGDGAIICYIQELIVHPDFQRMGIGKMLMEKLVSYVESITEEGTVMMLCLMCAKGREKFYEKSGFIPRPTDTLGPGMIKYIEK